MAKYALTDVMRTDAGRKYVLVQSAGRMGRLEKKGGALKRVAPDAKTSTHFCLGVT
jgi:hypothetical protein